MFQMEIRTILFDCDGVLIQSTPLHKKAYLAALARYDVRDFDYSMISGMSTLHSFDVLARSHSLDLTPEELENLTREKRRIFCELSENAREDVYPDHSGLFSKLSERFRIGIVSSASRRSLDQAIQRCRISSWVEVSISADDVMKSKPDPEPYLTGCTALGSEPRHTLVVEDARSGLISAQAAGCWAIGVGIDGAPLGRIENVQELLSKL